MIKKDTYLPHKQPNILEFVQALSINGNLKIKSSLIELMDLLRVIGDSILIPLMEEFQIFLKQKTLLLVKQRIIPSYQNLIGESFIVELVRLIRRTIYNDKSFLCNLNIHHLKLLRILEVELTSNDETFSKLSKELLQAISQKLWLPIKTDFQDSDSISSNGYFHNTESICWSSMKTITNLLNKNSQMTYFQSFMSSLAEILEKENIVQSTQIPNSQKQKIVKNNVTIDNNKKPCNFILTKNFDGNLYGRTCNNICENNTDRCKDHIDKNNILPENITIAPELCKHIITQKSGGIDRKGMVCGKFTFDSKNKNYCYDHNMRHNDDIDDGCIRTFKVRFYPIRSQYKKLQSFFGAARYTYNLCIQNKENDKSSTELRDQYVTKIVNKYPFLKKTPKEIRYNALQEYVSNRNNMEEAYKKAVKREEYCRNNYANYKHKNIEKYKMEFKKKKNSQSISIEKKSVKISNGEIKIYTNSFSNEKLSVIKRSKKDKMFNEILNGSLHHDIKIIKTDTDKYYICFSVDKEKKKISNEYKNICAIDPGIRTFGTLYNENKISEIGKDMEDNLLKLINKRENCKNKKLISEKIKNKMDDFHWKVINKLTENYSSIFIPKMNVKNLLEGDLNNKSKKILQIQSHCSFIKKLKEKCEIKGINMEIISERLTTKICSNCLTKNEPHSSKIYSCSCCKKVMDRDLNASKNIYMNAISEKLLKCLNLVKK